MKLFKQVSRLERAAALPLMPLIDIIFLILIFFVINVNLPPGGIEIDLPSAAAQRTSQELDEIVVTLNAQGDIFVENRGVKISEEELRRFLQPYQAQNNNQFFRLRADRSLPYGQVISILDLLAQVTENISLETVADVSRL